MMVTALTMSILLNAQLALIFAVAIPLLAAALFLILRKLRPAYGRMQRALDKVNSVVQENLTAIRVVKSFVRGDYECKKFQDVNEDFQKTSEHAFRFAALNMPCFQLVMYATIVAILWFGGGMVNAGSMQVGRLTGFLSYVLQILNSLMMISGVFMMLTRSMTSASRIAEVLDEVPGIPAAGGKARGWSGAASILITCISSMPIQRRNMCSPTSACTLPRGRRWGSWGAPDRPKPPWCSSSPAVRRVGGHAAHRRYRCQGLSGGPSPGRRGHGASEEYPVHRHHPGKPPVGQRAGRRQGAGLGLPGGLCR